MRLTADIFLALRYLRPKRTFVSVITLLSILGPTLGVAVLLVVNAVMAGFDKDIKQRLMDFQAHIQIFSLAGTLIEAPDKLIARLEELGYQAAPLVEGTALLQIRDAISPKLVKGIDPKLEPRVSIVHQCIVAGTSELKDGQALIGDRMASQLGLWVGQKILLHSPSRLTKNVHWKADGSVEVSAPDEAYLPEELTIVGIFNMGMSDIDDNVIFMHIDQAAELYGYEWGTASLLQCRVAKPMEVAREKARLQRLLPECEFVTWEERNAMLFGTLRVEKNLMTFLMAFVVLVASFSIAGTLITVVVQKTREIGVMKAVGMSRLMISRVFLFQGCIIGFIGTSLGVALGVLIILTREQIAAFLSFVMGHDVFPAEMYHLRQIPALLTGQDLTLTIILSFAICIFASLIPALYASMKEPAKALQEDN